MRDAYQWPEVGSTDKTNGAFPEVEPVRIRAVWLRHARFDHTAHRAVACIECHADAYSEGQNSSKLASDVLIPNIDNCVRCHAPRDEAVAKPLGGARHDCVECHHYHARDDLLAGKGSLLRGATPPLHTIDQFLKSFRSGD